MYLSVFSLVCLGLVLSDILVSNKSGHKVNDFSSTKYDVNNHETNY